MRRLLVLLGVLAALWPRPARAGAYLFVHTGARQDTSSSLYLSPGAILHPPGYTGAGGTITVSFCAEVPELVGPLQVALERWNALTPTTGNCSGCILWEESGVPPVPFDAESVLTHEVGHCGFGLGHPNAAETEDTPQIYRTGTCDLDSDNICGESTSFTASVNATEVGPGADTFRGSADDIHVNQCGFIPARSVSREAVPAADNLEEIFNPPPAACLAADDWLSSPAAEAVCSTCPNPHICCPDCPGPDCPVGPMQVVAMSWFRVPDNNPVVVDGLVIDQSTFTRNKTLLPAGSSYIASANRRVAESLGYLNTSTVMYSLLDTGTVYSGLAADDVNMAKMGRTGADRTAGTADDYSVRFVYRANCASAQVHVGFRTQGLLGLCTASVQESFPQGLVKLHQTLIPDTGQAPTQIISLNAAELFNFGRNIYRTGLEVGDLSEWSATVP